MKFYLVQRLESKKPFRTEQGFDGYFLFEYMGSSEFEWGAIPKALKEMRQRDAVIEPAEVTINGAARTVYFVGHPGVSAAAVAMEKWAAGTDRLRAFYGKESTHFDVALSGADPTRNPTDAWWDIENRVAWSLDREVAAHLVDAFNSRPVSKS